MAVGGHPSHPLGLIFVQLDLAREEGHTAEATRLTDKRKCEWPLRLVWERAAAKGHVPIHNSYYLNAEPIYLGIAFILCSSGFTAIYSSAMIYI